jgi:hypothetical protein
MDLGFRTRVNSNFFKVVESRGRWRDAEVKRDEGTRVTRGLVHTSLRRKAGMGLDKRFKCLGQADL